MDRRQFITAGSALALSSSVGCSTQPELPSVSSEIGLGTPLKDLAAQKGLRFGTAVGNPRGGAFYDPAYRAMMERECSILVAENEHKQYTIVPTDDGYNFERGDALVDYAKEHDMAFRGHVLLWDRVEFTPKWMNDVDWGSDPQWTMQQYLTGYFKKVCEHYGTRIESWDVVNETIDPSTGKRRDTLFSKHLGEDLIDFCFREAHRHAPHAQLVYNDYMIWEDGNIEHMSGVLDLLADLRKRSTPIHAVGIQSHLGTTTGNSKTGFPDPQSRRWREFVDEIVAMDYDILLTEFDVNDTYLTADIAKRDQIMADYAESYLDFMLDYKEVKDILAWELSDKYNWLKTWWPREDGLKKRPSLFDENDNPKRLYESVARALGRAKCRT